MQRALLALIGGALAGAAATYFAVGSHVGSPRDLVGADSPPAAGKSSTRREASPSAVTAERAALYREAADADVAALTKLISAAAALPPSRQRTSKLAVLLARYVELDAERAVTAARELGMDTETLAALYAQWATQDPASAVVALGDIENPAAATAIGLAMLPALGDDEYALQQVLAALPRAAEQDFRIGAIAELAASDPAAALDQALDLDDVGAGGLALERVGAAWGRRDPRAALAAAAAVGDGDLRLPFQNAVLRAWAQVDSNGLLDYVLGLDSETQQRLGVMTGMMDVARLDPERMLAVSRRLPVALRGSLERTALETLARQDPEAALARSRTMAAQLQQSTRQVIARAYGKKDPDAALAWARASGERDALVGVLAGIAVKDANRALDEATSLPTQDRQGALLQIVSGATTDRDADLAALAERLLALDDERVTSPSMSQLVNTWQARSPERSLEWVLANAARVPPVAFQSAARFLTLDDPAAAEQRLAQIPAEGRTAWLQGMAQAYVQNDPAAGAAWVERFRGDPAFPVAAGAIAQGLARSDAPAAAALLDSIGQRGGPAAQTMAFAFNSVANSWARTNPAAAAEWARSFGADEMGAQTLSTVSQIWSGTDYAAARAWTLRLPSGAARDAALRPLLVTGGNNVDTSLLASFSADATRQQAVMQAAMQIVGRDPKEARALVDRYVTRPDLREQANRNLDLSTAGRIAPFVPVF